MKKFSMECLRKSHFGRLVLGILTLIVISFCALGYGFLDAYFISEERATTQGYLFFLHFLAAGCFATGSLLAFLLGYLLLFLIKVLPETQREIFLLTSASAFCLFGLLYFTEFTFFLNLRVGLLSMIIYSAVGLLSLWILFALLWTSIKLAKKEFLGRK